MRPKGAGIEPEWIWTLLESSKLLAIGSMVLLGASILAPFMFIASPYGFGSSTAFMVLTIVGVLVHLLGWVALDEGSRLWPPMRVAFIVSVLTYITGLILFLLTGPPYPGFFLLFGGWLTFPYLPIAYGPVVIAHAALFLLASIRLRPAHRMNPLVIGCALLLAIALGGLYLQATEPFESRFRNWFPLAGLTSVGYGLIFMQFRDEYDRRQVHLRPTWADAPERPGPVPLSGRPPP